MNKKFKIISIVTIFTLIISQLPFITVNSNNALSNDKVITKKNYENDQVAVSEQGFIYRVLDDDSISIIGTEYNYNGLELHIPEKIDGYTVTEIGEYAFPYDFISLTMPDTIVKIEDYAFTSSPSDSSSNSTKTYYEDYTDNDKNNNIYYSNDKFYISKNLEYIGDYAFSGVVINGDIVLPENLTYLGVGAFQYAYNVHNVIINDKLEVISSSAFYALNQRVSGRYEVISKLDNNDDNYVEDTVLANADVEVVTGDYDYEDYVLPVDYANSYEGLDIIVNVTIGKNVVKIESSAFSGTKFNIDFGENNVLKEIQNNALYLHMDSFKIPESVEIIANQFIEGEVDTLYLSQKNINVLDDYVDDYINENNFNFLLDEKGIIDIENIVLSEDVEYITQNALTYFNDFDNISYYDSYWEEYYYKEISKIPNISFKGNEKNIEDLKIKYNDKNYAILLFTPIEKLEETINNSLNLFENTNTLFSEHLDIEFTDSLSELEEDVNVDIHIPDNITKIEQDFILLDDSYSSRYLENGGRININIYLGKNVQEFSPKMFTEKNDIYNVMIYLDEENPYFVQNEDGIFSKDLKTLYLLSPNTYDINTNYYEVPNYVESIEAYAMQNLPIKARVRISDSVKYLKENAFNMYIDFFDYIYIPDSIEVMEQYSLPLTDILRYNSNAVRVNNYNNYYNYYGYRRNGTFHLPKNLKRLERGNFTGDEFGQIIAYSDLELGEYALQYSDVNGITFRNGAKLLSISKGSFANTYVSTLNNTNFPDNAIEIPPYAYASTSTTSTLTIPSRVTKIGEGAFFKKGFTNLVFDSNSPITVIEEDTFSRSDYDYTYVIDRPVSVGEIQLPTNLERIENGAFSGIAPSILKIPESVTYIGDGEAIGDLRNLKEFKLPDSLEYLGSGALYGLSTNSIKIPDNIKTLQEYTLAQSKIQEVDLNNIEVIGRRAFYSSAVYLVKNADNVIKIEEEAFEDAENLTDLEGMRSLEYIGQRAFVYAANNLTNFDFINESTKYIGESAFYSYYYDDEDYVVKPMLNLSENIEFIGDYAFENVRVDDLNISFNKNENTRIYPYIFSQAEIGNLNIEWDIVTNSMFVQAKINNLNLSDNVKEIHASAFEKTIINNKVIMPKNLNFIDDKAFYEAELKDGIELNDKLNIIGDYAFYGVNIDEDLVLHNNFNYVGKSAFNSVNNVKIENPNILIGNINSFGKPKANQEIAVCKESTAWFTLKANNFNVITDDTLCDDQKKPLLHPVTNDLRTMSFDLLDKENNIIEGVTVELYANIQADNLDGKSISKRKVLIDTFVTTKDGYQNYFWDNYFLLSTFGMSDNNIYRIDSGSKDSDYPLDLDRYKSSYYSDGYINDVHSYYATYEFKVISLPEGYTLSDLKIAEELINDLDNENTVEESNENLDNKTTIEDFNSDLENEVIIEDLNNEDTAEKSNEDLDNEVIIEQPNNDSDNEFTVEEIQEDLDNEDTTEQSNNDYMEFQPFSIYLTYTGYNEIYWLLKDNNVKNGIMETLIPKYAHQDIYSRGPINEMMMTSSYDSDEEDNYEEPTFISFEDLKLIDGEFDPIHNYYSKYEYCENNVCQYLYSDNDKDFFTLDTDYLYLKDENVIIELVVFESVMVTNESNSYYVYHYGYKDYYLNGKNYSYYADYRNYVIYLDVYDEDYNYISDESYEIENGFEMFDTISSIPSGDYKFLSFYESDKDNYKDFNQVLANEDYIKINGNETSNNGNGNSNIIIDYDYNLQSNLSNHFTQEVRKAPFTTNDKYMLFAYEEGNNLSVNVTLDFVKLNNTDLPTEPVEPTEPPTEPVEPTEPPTEPVEPTEPPTEPVEPTEPPTEPVEPTEPTESPTEPVEPTEPPTEPEKPTIPIRPVPLKPVEPIIVPNKPTEPTKPPVKPTEPKSPIEPTTPPIEPTEPTTPPVEAEVPKTPPVEVTKPEPVVEEDTPVVAEKCSQNDECTTCDYLLWIILIVTLLILTIIIRISYLIRKIKKMEEEIEES